MTTMQESASCRKPEGSNQFASGLLWLMTCFPIQGSHSRTRSSPISYPTSSILISQSCTLECHQKCSLAEHPPGLTCLAPVTQHQPHQRLKSSGARI